MAQVAPPVDLGSHESSAMIVLPLPMAKALPQVWRGGVASPLLPCPNRVLSTDGSAGHLSLPLNLIGNFLLPFSV